MARAPPSASQGAAAPPRPLPPHHRRHPLPPAAAQPRCQRHPGPAPERPSAQQTSEAAAAPAPTACASAPDAALLAVPHESRSNTSPFGLPRLRRGATMTTAMMAASSPRHSYLLLFLLDGVELACLGAVAANQASFGEMLSSEGGADDLTRSSNENKRTCSGEEEEVHSLISGIWSELSEGEKSKSVVSIALSDRKKVLFASSGIAIECQCNLTRFVTSASLVSALHAVENVHDHVKIKVLHHEGNAALGILEKYDLDYGIAVVRVMAALNVYCIPLNYEVELMPNGTRVVALGRDITGVLLCKYGTLTATGRSKDSGCHMFSTSKLCEVMQGGALFGFDGNFIGMNIFFNGEESIDLPRSIILDRLKHLETSLKKRIFCVMLKSFSPVVPLTIDTMSCLPGSTKVNTFEECFGDEYPTGVWSEFKKPVSSKIHDVVALASFHGDSKFFACTEFFIDYDKYPTILTSASLVRDPNGLNEIVGGLRIEVLLPDNKRCVGKLKRYSLHYNVALVSIKNYNVDCPVNLKNNEISFCVPMVAVGRCFESGVLMATGGNLTTDRPGESIAKIFITVHVKPLRLGLEGPLLMFKEDIWA